MKLDRKILLKNLQKINISVLRGYIVRYWKRLLLFTVILLVIIFSYRFFTAEPKGITASQASQKSLTQSFTANGKINAKNISDLKFNLPSRVSWISVKKGDQVNSWQGVAGLDRRLLEKDLKSALLQYQVTRWDFETTQNDTYKDQLITDVIKRVKEKSQFSLDQSVLNVEIKDIVLKESVLITPIKGTVVEINGIVPGLYLGSADLDRRFIRVVDLNSLYFDAQVDEVDYGKIKINQKVIVNIDAYPGKSCQGNVNLIGKQGQETVGGVVTIPVEVSLDNCPPDLAVNLNGQAQFITREVKNAIVIPKKYLINKNGEYFVWVQTGKSTRQRQLKRVKTGAENTTEIQITEGISANDTVIYIPA